MKLWINIALSLAVLFACVWMVWPRGEEATQLEAAFSQLDLVALLPYLGGYLALLATTHFCRAWRWKHLLAPIGVYLPPKRLLAISTIGFMAILALPFRLGELVRPALIRRRGEVSASAALGTIAVERIIDGLLVSLLVFSAFYAIRSPASPDWMMPTAYAALGVFAAAMLFLGFALKWPRGTVRAATTLSGLRLISMPIATKIEGKLHSMISGFFVFRDPRRLIIFIAWSVIYWGANGLGLWVLARGFGLELSWIGAFATMGLVAVGITLPNSPGLIGQFQWFTVLGLSLYLPEKVAGSTGLAFAIVLYAIQVLWYLGMGRLAMASRDVSFAEVWASRKIAADDDSTTASAPAATNPAALKEAS
ncbi:MAG TPA: lysylphosphatidylglycerol synthase transmembrane domain-containing protein [Kofleriaceae bacterium]|nr:lysylphosphatidylglycerol synthase transmembrane domain-containing protein [Kofleriaceae bacterium]